MSFGLLQVSLEPLDRVLQATAHQHRFISSFTAGHANLLLEKEGEWRDPLFHFKDDHTGVIMFSPEVHFSPNIYSSTWNYLIFQRSPGKVIHATVGIEIVPYTSRFFRWSNDPINSRQINKRKSPNVIAYVCMGTPPPQI